MQYEHAYQRIAAVFRDKITEGALQPGDNLPAQGKLCEEFGVSRTTIRQALALLEREQLIKGGRGGRATVMPLLSSRDTAGGMDIRALREELSTLHEAAQTLERHIHRLRQSLEPRR